MLPNVPIDFLRRLRVPLTWAEVKYGYENGFVNAQTVIDYACEVISQDCNHSDDVVDLACARPSESISEILGRIVVDNPDSIPDARKRWAFILSSFVSTNDVMDRLSAVEEIYESLDYPVELAPFIRYMPMVGPDLGSVAANEQRLLDELKLFGDTIVASAIETAGQ